MNSLHPFWDVLLLFFGIWGIVAISYYYKDTRRLRARREEARTHGRVRDDD